MSKIFLLQLMIMSYCMRMTICVYFEMWTIEYNELVTFSFLLLRLGFKHASTRPLLAIVNVYKIMILLGSSVIIAPSLAYLFNNLQFEFSRPSSAFF